MTPIPRAERLIVALDVATPNEAKALVERLGDAARFYKLGLELFMAGGYFQLLRMVGKRRNKGFVDLKVFYVAGTGPRAGPHLPRSGACLCPVPRHQALKEAGGPGK